MSVDFYIVDAFTTKPFKGNPAAVVMLESFPEDAVMQLVAAQMNLSETAFVVEEGFHQYGLRWFTPEIEISLCGHATLATMHVLRQTGAVEAGDIVTFSTRSGNLSAQALEKTIELDFPVLAPERCAPEAALKHLGVDTATCLRTGDNYLIEVKDFDTLVSCKPAFKKLAAIKAEGVIVTTNKNVPAGFDFASRYFAPGIGIDEDPVTGSSHCTLAPYWAKKLNKTRFHALQASRAEGVLDITLKGERVLIAGPCVTTLKGQIELPKMKKVKGKSA